MFNKGATNAAKYMVNIIKPMNNETNKKYNNKHWFKNLDATKRKKEQVQQHFQNVVYYNGSTWSDIKKITHVNLPMHAHNIFLYEYVTDMICH